MQLHIRKRNPRRQISESLLLGSILAVAGGFLDVYTYLARDGVFANAQTGNIVLLGLNAAEGDFAAALRYLYPILAFVAGVFLAELVRKYCGDSPDLNLHWRQVIVLIEILVLLGISFVPNGAGDNLVNIAVSFVCSMQVESFRKVRGNPYATTMCTGNLRSATDYLFQYLQDKDRTKLHISLHYYVIILFFILGAVLGVFCTNLLGHYAVLICCALLLLVFIIMFLEEKEGARKAEL